MGYFRIKNISNELGKRHIKHNTVQNIEFKGGLHKAQISVQPGKEFFVECQYLPVGVQKLRNEGLMIVDEIDSDTYHKLLKEQEQQTNIVVEAKSNEPANIVETEEKSKKVLKKRQ